MPARINTSAQVDGNVNEIIIEVSNVREEKKRGRPVFVH